MSNVTAIRAPETATPATEAVPLADLYLSDLNPRQDADPEGIALLAESIRLLGLIQNPAGFRDAEGRVGIVAGGRRLRALQKLADSHPHLAGERPEIVAPHVRIAPDESTARAWASAENAARQDLHPADEIRAYGKMAATGAPVPTIASAFGQTEAHVRRRLALANLPAPVIDALRAGEISIGAAAAFTVSEDEALSLQVLEGIRGRPISEHRIKQELQPQSIRATDRRASFVGLTAYEQAGGKITRDLFSEDVFLADPALLNDLFRDALTKAGASIEAEGWKWVEVVEDAYVGWERMDKLDRLYKVEGDLTEDEAGRYDELAEWAEGDALDEATEAEFETLTAKLDGAYTEDQKVHSGVIAYVDNQGALQPMRGLVRREGRAAAIEAGVLPKPYRMEQDDAPKQPYSAKLQDDLNAAALGARQNATVDHADLILDLLAWQLSGGMGYRRAFELRAEPPRNMPETETGFTLDERLTKKAASPKDPWGSDLAKGFRAFRKKGREHRDAELIRHLTRLLAVSDEGLGKLIDKEAETSLRSVWTPTAENLFKRMKGDWLDALWNDLLECGPQSPRATSFAKKKKGEKAETLESLFANPGAFDATPEQITKIDAWVPDHFA